MQVYAAMIDRVDQNIGKLMAKIKALGDEDNTPFRYGKNLSYEGGIRTPFIAHWPKVIKNKGSINEQPVHFVDIMATIREIADATYPAHFNGQRVTPLQGESLLPALHGRKLPNRKNPLFFEYSRSGAVREGQWKIVSKTLPRSKEKKEADLKWELYNLNEDSTETLDVADENSDIVNRLSQLWQNWYRTAYGF